MTEPKDSADLAGGGIPRPDAAVRPDAPAADAAAATPAGAGRPGRSRGRARAGLFLLLSLILVGMIGVIVVLGLTGTTIRLPVWAVAEAETRLNHSIARAIPEGAVSIGGIDMGVDDDWVPRLRLEDVRLLSGKGQALLTLPETRLAFDPAAMFDGYLRPSSLRISGARIDIRRDAEGRFDFAFGAGQIGPRIDSIPALFDLVDHAFAVPLLSRLTRIEADALTLTLRDERAGRTWEVGDGRLRLENLTEEIRAELGVTTLGASGALAQAQITVVSEKGRPQARVTAAVDGVAAADLASLAAPLVWLGVLDAPISGRLATTLGAEGITALDGSLTLGRGALRPTDGVRPINFDRASLQVAFDPEHGRVNLTELEVQSPSLRLRATGQSYLQAEDGGFMTGALGSRLPAAFLTQIHIAEAMVDPEGLFEEPVRFTEGALDLRLRLDPFRVELGQLSLSESGHSLTARGSIGADAAGWQVALDVALDRIRHDRLLALWPKTLVPKTRAWLETNVLDGTLSGVKAALRVKPGTEPRLTLGYDFTDTDVRFIRTMPPITAADGYATIDGQTYTMVVSRGSVTPPLGGVIDMAGSVFSVLDITRRPAQAEVRLKTDSSLTAALSILDEPPFGYLTKAGRPVDLGEGRAIIDAVLRFPLVPKLMPGDVSFSVTGQVLGFASSKIVPGKMVVAPELSVSADPRGLRISGPGAVGAMPFDVTFTQPFGAEAATGAQVAGRVALSQATVDEFGLGLPEGMVTGDGWGQAVIALPKGEPARLTLTSDLAGIGVTIPGTGWTKPPEGPGNLDVAAVLSQPAVIERLALSGPGLQAEGKISLRAGGGLDVARFSPVLIGDWLRGSVEITGRGAGAPVAVAITGGELDLREMNPSPGGEGKGSDIPLAVQLDKLTVTDTMALTGFDGQFTLQDGFRGEFSAAMNGRAALTGSVAPTVHGSGVRIRSTDAGAVLSAAGVFSSARGGDLDMTLIPRATDGIYDGVADISRVRVAEAPVLAELLSAISVVGLLEQLNGEGLLFNSASGDFIVTPGAVEITRASATGVSLGVSMAGVYETESKALALQGVVSPLYLLNGIGAGLTRRGEGIFGFNYAVRGTSERAIVSVNPLSILTPGRFRELFRGDAPTLQDGALDTEESGG